MSTTTWTPRYYLMNTRTRVMTDQPQCNEFGHANGCTFLWIVDENGRNPKVVADYGTPPPVGAHMPCTQDTGLGHRKIRDADQVQTGTLPAQRTLPFWVCK